MTLEANDGGHLAFFIDCNFKILFSQPRLIASFSYFFLAGFIGGAPINFSLHYRERERERETAPNTDHLPP